MKNRDLNKNILKAISIGIAATMALMPTVNAYADDNVEPEPTEPTPTEDAQSAGVEESNANNEVKEEVAEAQEAVQEALTGATPTVEAVTSDAAATDTTVAGDASATDTMVTGDAAATDIAVQSVESVQYVENGTDNDNSLINQAAALDAQGAEVTMPNGVTIGATDAVNEQIQDTSEIKQDLENIQPALDDISADLKTLDQANAVVEEANEDLLDLVKDAGEGSSVLENGSTTVAVNNAGDAVSAAAESTKATGEAVNADAQTAEEKRDIVVDAAAKVYESAEAAASAKEKALSDVDTAIAAQQDAEKVSDAAQEKLDNAKTVLDVAEGEVDKAQKAKAAADEAADNAKTKLKSLLDKNGISYTEDADGNIIVDENDVAYEGSAKTAVDNAKAAVDKAEEKVSEAEVALTAANENATNAANGVNNAAAANVTAAQTTRDEAETNLNSTYSDTTQASLNVMISSIKDQQQKVKESATYSEYEQNANKLAEQLAVYQLTQTAGVSDVQVVSNNNGNITISYVENGETKTSKYGYTAYQKTGERTTNSVFTSEYLDPDHGYIIVFERSYSADSTEGIYEFASKGEQVMTITQSGLTATETDSDAAKELIEKINNISSGIANNNWNIMNNIAAQAAEYYLYSNMGLDLDMMSYSESNGNANVWHSTTSVNGNGNYIQINYTESNGKVTKYYFDYSGVNNYSDGMSLLMKQVLYNTSTDSLISEAGFNNETDGYQSALNNLKSAKSALEAAKTSQTAAAVTAASYGDTTKAAEAVTKAQADLDASTFKQSDSIENLLATIAQQVEDADEVRNSSVTTTWDARAFSTYCAKMDALSYSMASYYLQSQGNTVKKVGEFEKGTENSQQHRFAVEYVTPDGKTKTAYFDYSHKYANGENIAREVVTTSNKPDLLTRADGAYIVLLEKEKQSDGTFSIKGDDILSSTCFANGTDPYTVAKKQHADLEKALADAKTTEKVANAISKNTAIIEQEVALAKGLAVNVVKAKAEVDEAIEALKKARATQAMNGDLLTELEEKLQDAKDKYEDAVKEKEASDEKLEELQEVVQEAIDAVGVDFKYVIPVDSETDTPTPTPSTQTETPETVTPSADTTTPTPSKETTTPTPSAETTTPTPSAETTTPTPSAETTTPTPSAETTTPTPSTETARPSTETATPSTETATPSTETATPSTDTTSDASATVPFVTPIVAETETSTPLISFGTPDAGVLGDTAAPAAAETVAATAAEASGRAADSGVLGEREAPEGDGLEESGVLGERQAPVQDPESFNLADSLSKQKMMSERGILKLNFWWWAVIALLGGTGYDLYKKHQKKVAAKAELEEDK